MIAIVGFIQFINMQPHTIRNLKTLVLICLFTCLAGVIFQLINEKRLDHNSVLVGLPLGFVFGVLELFILPGFYNRVRHWPFSKMILVKTLLYTLVIYFVTIALAIPAGLSEGHKWSELPPMIVSKGQLVLVAYALAVYSLLVFFLQINKVMGEGILWKFIRGKYHKPREEERIFMFLDMKSSTTIAEQLGHVRFYSLLNEVFHEITRPVLETNAEIYQYVGDEVILTWDLIQGLKNSNCLKSFFMFQDSLHKNRDNYIKNYGVEPEFKAGLHFGKVISAQIGDIKREIVYNGDVLNTTSRIQNQCNKYHRNCLVSGTLMRRLWKKNEFKWEKLEAVTLRGKEQEVELFSVANIPGSFATAS